MDGITPREPTPNPTQNSVLEYTLHVAVGIERSCPFNLVFETGVFNAEGTDNQSSVEGIKSSSDANPCVKYKVLSV